MLVVGDWWEGGACRDQCFPGCPFDEIFGGGFVEAGGVREREYDGTVDTAYGSVLSLLRKRTHNAYGDG